MAVLGSSITVFHDPNSSNSDDDSDDDDDETFDQCNSFKAIVRNNGNRISSISISISIGIRISSNNVTLLKLI